MRIITELEAEIRRREAELTALKTALATIKGGGSKTAAKPAGTRRPMSEEARRKLSRKMKALWKEKQAATKKSG